MLEDDKKPNFTGIFWGVVATLVGIVIAIISCEVFKTENGDGISTIGTVLLIVGVVLAAFGYFFIMISAYKIMKQSKKNRENMSQSEEEFESMLLDNESLMSRELKTCKFCGKKFPANNKRCPHCKALVD